MTEGKGFFESLLDFSVAPPPIIRLVRSRFLQSSSGSPRARGEEVIGPALVISPLMFTKSGNVYMLAHSGNGGPSRWAALRADHTSIFVWTQ
jgi:hypothetical protein